VHRIKRTKVWTRLERRQLRLVVVMVVVVVVLLLLLLLLVLLRPEWGWAGRRRRQSMMARSKGRQGRYGRARLYDRVWRRRIGHEKLRRQ
jgi:Tfp pilus assembly protein PilN